MSVPAVLYKYRSLSGESSQRFTRSILVDGTLYFASPRELNDPFESRFSVSFGERPESELIPKESYIKNHFARHIRESIVILSLTSKCDDILMWSHYADSHRGICIGFDTSGESNFFQSAQPVVYSADFHVLAAYTMSFKSQLERAFLTKYKKWEYEDEWRMVDRGPSVRGFPQKLIRSVIIGHSISDQDRHLVLSWIDDLDNAVPVFQARLNGEGYKIELQPVAA
jgi:hypothetical protein